MFDRARTFLRDVKVETKKVVFPGRDELIGSTKVVIVAAVIAAFFLGAVDLVLSKFVQYILN